MHDTHQIFGHQLTLMQNGTEFFPQLCDDIDAARYSVYLETYIFEADQAGRRVVDALQRAAERGVEVRLLLDGYGSAELPQQWVDDLRSAKAQVRWFRRDISPFVLRRYRRRMLHRMHRKIAVIDGDVAFVGGINIINDIPAYTDLSAPQLDYAVRVKGQIASEIQAAMRHLWNVVSWANFRGRERKSKWRVASLQEPVNSTDIIFMTRDNVRHRRDIEREYLNAINAAQQEIIIANAYFLPGKAFRQALMDSARRGVSVVLLLQGKVEFWIQHYATHSLYEELLSVGIEIYEYQSSYLHAKVAVIDGMWATVGSSNIDPFSLLLAREANLVVRHAGFAAELRASLLDIIKNEVSRVELTKESYLIPFLSRISYSVIRFLVGVVGYSKWH